MFLMHNSPHRNILLIVFVSLLCGGIYFFLRNDPLPEVMVEEPIRTLSAGPVTYLCTGGKNITVVYYEGPQMPPPNPGEPPSPTGSADVSLDDGPVVTLRQTISASGVRYADNDESVVFWNKGNEAFVMRDGSVDPDYAECAAQNE